MPHIGIKMLKGRTPEQKEKLSAALVKTLVEQLGCSELHDRRFHRAGMAGNL